jgi:DNA-binding NarL/FixJ family response regulator
MRLGEEIGGAGGPQGARCRVIVADGQPLVAAALGTLVTDFGYAVTALAHDADGLHTAIADKDCDLLLVDIGLFDRDLARNMPVVVMAPVSTHPGLAAALAQGISGLILRTESADLLSLCLTRVVAGGHWFDNTALADVAVQVEAQKDAELLTRRERDVARLVAAGQRNRGIAAALGISEGTVKMHLHNVYTKLGLESRTQLAMDERLRNPLASPASGGFGAPVFGYGRQRRQELVA